jgi:hypothetical protein
LNLEITNREPWSTGERMAQRKERRCRWLRGKMIRFATIYSHEDKRGNFLDRPVRPVRPTGQTSHPQEIRLR